MEVEGGEEVQEGIPPEPEEIQQDIEYYRDTESYDSLLALLIPLIRNSQRVREPILTDDAFWGAKMREFFPEVTSLIAAFPQAQERADYSYRIRSLMFLLYCDSAADVLVDLRSTSFVSCSLGLLRSVRDDEAISKRPYIAKFFSRQVTERCLRDDDYAYYISLLYRRVIPFGVPHHSFYFKEHAKVRKLFARFCRAVGFLLEMDSPYMSMFEELLRGLLDTELRDRLFSVNVEEEEEGQIATRVEELERLFVSEQDLSAFPLIDAARLQSFFETVARRLVGERVDLASTPFSWFRIHGYKLIPVGGLVQQLIRDAMEEVIEEGAIPVRYFPRDVHYATFFTGAERLVKMSREYNHLKMRTERSVLDFLLDQQHCFNVDVYPEVTAFRGNYPKLSLTMDILTLCQQDPQRLKEQRARRCHEGLISYFQPGLEGLIQWYRGFIIEQFPSRPGEISTPDYPEDAIYIAGRHEPFSTGLNRFSYAVWRLSGLAELIANLDLNEPVLCEALTNWSLELEPAFTKQDCGDRFLILFLQLLKFITEKSKEPKMEDLLQPMKHIIDQIQRDVTWHTCAGERASQSLREWDRTYRFVGNDTVVRIFHYLIMALRDSRVPIRFQEEETPKEGVKRVREPPARVEPVSQLGREESWQLIGIIIDNTMQTGLSEKRGLDASNVIFDLVKRLMLTTSVSPSTMRKLFSNDSFESGKFWLLRINQIALPFIVMIWSERTGFVLKTEAKKIPIAPLHATRRKERPEDVMIADEGVTVLEPQASNGEKIESTVSMTKTEIITREIRIVTQWQLIRGVSELALISSAEGTGGVVKLGQLPMPLGVDKLNFGQLFHLASFRSNPRPQGPIVTEIIQRTLWFSFSDVQRKPIGIERRMTVGVREKLFLDIFRTTGEIIFYLYFNVSKRYFLHTAVDVSEYYETLKAVLQEEDLPRLVRLRCLEKKIQLPVSMQTLQFFQSLFKHIRAMSLLDTFVWVPTQPTYVVDELRRLITSELDLLFHGPSSMGFESPSELNFMYKLYSYLVASRYYALQVGKQGEYRVPHPWQSIDNH